LTDTNNTMLIARAEAEKQWLNKVGEISNNNFVAIPWLQDASIQNISNLADSVNFNRVVCRARQI